MAENTKIAWATHTFNPIIGCQKVSPACKFCYAEREVNRYGGNFHGRRVITADANWRRPLKWNRDCEKESECFDCGGPISMANGCRACGLPPIRPRVFCASWSDVFEDYDGPILNHKGEQLYRSWHHAQPDWIATDKPCEGEPVTMSDVRGRLFDLIDATPNLSWLLLTKRPENIRRMWPKVVCDHLVCEASKGTGVYCPHDSCDVDDNVREARRNNVWLGATVENQEYADKRIPELLRCRDLSPVLFLSCEPLLGGLDLSHWLAIEEDRDMRWRTRSKFGESPEIDWVIAGTESGSHRRPADNRWIESLREQCKCANVPFFVKQLEIDGKVCKDIAEFPERLRVQEFPKVVR